MTIIDVLKELFGKEKEENMLTELKSLFAPGKELNAISVMLNGVSQLIGFVEQNLANESLRNSAIDAVIKILQDEKK